MAGWISVALEGILNVLTTFQVAFGLWMAAGGWKLVLRSVSFFLDRQLVKFIAKAYYYFNLILNGTMFNENLVNDILRNIYVFIGVIVFFRLMMVVIKYLINPDLIDDAKVGANSLIRRCILGFAGILFIPTIFSLAMRLQSAILTDQIIQKIIIPNNLLEAVEKKIDSGGQYIGTYVLAGFISPKGSASQKSKEAYDVALSKGDFSSLEINEGGFMANEDTYEYDYFFLISTLVLAYVFYQMMKYTIDLAVRAFKLLIYQILAPVAMIEYMINGSDDGVFKSWKNAILSTYVMVFTRVLAIWFVVFVTLLMSDSSSPLLSNYVQGSLLAEDDYLLRTIIIIALLGFMMDLPKILGQVFGLDLEQESSATGVLKQVGGMVKGAAMGALAVGGAAVGSAVGTASSITSASKSANAEVKAKKANGGYVDASGNQLTGSALKQAMQSDRSANFKKNMSNMSVGAQVRGMGAGMLTAALGSNKFTSAATSSFSQNKRAQEQNASNSAYAQEAKKLKEEESRKEQSAANKAMASGSMKLDPSSIAAMAGAVAGAIHATSGPGTSSNASASANPSPNPSSTFTQQQASTSVVGGPTQGQVSNGTTVTLDNIDVKVNGKATATYDGGLETNITGKATTTYNDGLDVQVAGQANAKYDQGIDVQVNGPANATYDRGIDVQVNGPANAKYDQGIDVQVGGTVSAKYDGDVSTVVGGSSVTTVEGGTNTVVVGDTVTTVAGNTEVNLQDVDVKRNKNNRDSNNA